VEEGLAWEPALEQKKKEQERREQTGQKSTNMDKWEVVQLVLVKFLDRLQLGKETRC